jgi:hypothetical protein
VFEKSVLKYQIVKMPPVPRGGDTSQDDPKCLNTGVYSKNILYYDRGDAHFLCLSNIFKADGRYELGGIVSLF